MAINNEAVSEAIEAYVTDVKNAMPIDMVYLFGSYAKGAADEHSDIDLCFFSENFENQDTMEVVKLLYRMTRPYKGMDIQPCVFARSDLETDNPFVKEILRTGKAL